MSFVLAQPNLRSRPLYLRFDRHDLDAAYLGYLPYLLSVQQQPHQAALGACELPTELMKKSRLFSLARRRVYSLSTMFCIFASSIGCPAAAARIWLSSSSSEQPLTMSPPPRRPCW